MFAGIVIYLWKRGAIKVDYWEAQDILLRYSIVGLILAGLSELGLLPLDDASSDLQEEPEHEG